MRTNLKVKLNSLLKKSDNTNRHRIREWNIRSNAHSTCTAGCCRSAISACRNCSDSSTLLVTNEHTQNRKKIELIWTKLKQLRKERSLCDVTSGRGMTEATQHLD